MKQLMKEEAIELAKSGVWKKWPDETLVGFQLSQDLLCVDFSAFHVATERVLNRPVYTHEFGLNRDGLISEYLGHSQKPTFEEIVNLIPEAIRVIILKC